MKSQAVRLVDVFVLGPYLLYVSTRPGLSAFDRTALAISGVLTIAYNADNYLRARAGRAAS